MADQKFEEFLQSLDELGEQKDTIKKTGNFEFDSFMEELDDLDDLKYNNPEEEILRDVFKNKPEIVDHYFKEKSKDPSFQITKDTLKQFGVDQDVPKLNFGSFSDFWSSAKEQKNTDLDRFSNLTATKFVYPLKDLDDQESLNAYYNLTRRNQSLGEQDWKPSFGESLAVGTSEGLSRAAKGVSTALAEAVDWGLDTNFLTEIEENWTTMDLEGNGVADFARFASQYGVGYGVALKLLTKIKGYQKLAGLGAAGGVLGRISSFGGKIGYYGIPGVPSAYLLTSDEKDVPIYALDNMGSMLGLEEATTLEDEAELYGSEKASAAMRNRLRVALNEGTMTGLFGATLPAALKYAIGYPIYYGGGFAMKGLNAHLNLYAYMMKGGYAGMKWGVDGTGKVFSKAFPGTTEKLGTWFNNASRNMFPKFEDWRMFDWTSSNFRERWKGAAARTLEYLSSNGRWTPATKDLQRQMLNKVRGDHKKVDAILTELERSLYKIADTTNKYGQVNNSLRREMLYDDLINFLKNKPGYTYKMFNFKGDPKLSKEMQDRASELYVLIRDLKRDSGALAPRLLEGTGKNLDNFYDDIKSYLTQSYAVLKSRAKFKPEGKLVDEAAAWYHQIAKNVPGMDLKTSRQIITDIIRDARTGSFSPAQLEKHINNILQKEGVNYPLLKKGENMPQMMQRLMGAETDPKAIIMDTVSEFSSALWKGNFYNKLIQLNDDLIAAGQKPFMFKGESSGSHIKNAKKRFEFLKGQAQAAFKNAFPNIGGTPLNKISVLKEMRLPVGKQIEQYFTTPSFAKALFDDGIGIDKLNKFEFMRMLLLPKALVSAGKTVGSWQTIIRNFTTAATFPMIMGLVGKGADMTTGFRFMLRDIVGKSKMTSDDFVELTKEYAERGITDQSAHAGELQVMLAEIGSGAIDTTAKLTKRFINNFVTKKLIDVYQGGDYIWRIYGYHALESIYKPILKNPEYAASYYSQIFKRKFDPLDMAGKPKDMLEIIKQTSAEMVSSSFPTYSRVPYITQEVRNFPFLGNFVSFASEMLRSIPQNLLYIRREINFVHPDKAFQEAIRYMGWRRLLGLSTVMGAPYAVTAMAKKGTGITDEKMDAYQRSVAPPWGKTGTIPISAQDEEGRFWINNLNTVFPHYMFNAAIDDLFKARTEEELWTRVRKRIFGESLIGQDRDPGFIDHMFGPFTDIPIYLEVIGEVARNKKRSGGEIWKPGYDNFDDIISKSLEHIFKGFRPTTLKQLEDTMKALNRERGPDGRPLNVKQQLAKWLAGFSTSVVDPKQSYGYKMYDMSQMMGDPASGFKNTMLKDTNPTKQLSFDSYKKELIGRFKAMKELKIMVDDFMTLGLTEDDILEQKRRPGMGPTLESVLANEFLSREIKYGDTLLNNKAEDLGKEIDDIIDFDRIDDLRYKIDGISLDMSLEDFKRIIETGQLPVKDEDKSFEEYFQELDQLSAVVPQQPATTQTTTPPIIPITPPQVMAAAPQVVSPAARGTEQGLTPTEMALLSPDEQVIKLRQNRNVV